MKKSSIVQRSKASSTWRNNTPPSKQVMGTVILTVPITIPVGTILIGVAMLLIIWGML